MMHGGVNFKGLRSVEGRLTTSIELLEMSTNFVLTFENTFLSFCEGIQCKSTRLCQVKRHHGAALDTYFCRIFFFFGCFAGRRVVLLCGKLLAQSKQLVAQLTVSVSNKRRII